MVYKGINEINKTRFLDNLNEDEYSNELFKYIENNKEFKKSLIIKAKELAKTPRNSLKVNEALKDIFELLKRSNRYIDDTTTWILAKDESKFDRLKAVLYNLLESIRISAILLRLFIPTTRDKIFNMLNIKNIDFNTLDFGSLETNIKLNEE